jgi:diguanylate cyclase (GGDEF)-like protein
MESDEKLAEVLSEFARTMLTDFPIQRIVDRLVARIVEVMPVDGAGVTLISPDGGPHYIAASDGKAMEFERLQSELGEGPCMDVYTSGAPVCVADIGEETRFPKFTAEALKAGLAAVFAFPLRHGESQLGALDLYRDIPGPLEPAALKSAQTLADVAAAYLLNAKARSDLQTSLNRSQKAALHDPLTGLPNRVLLFEFLDQALRRAGRSGKVTTILFCDLDRFKRINDAFGHRVGDELLVGVSERLTALMRPSDILARLAGDEFVILFDSLEGFSEAKLIAERIVRSFDIPFPLSVGRVEVAASVGIAIGGATTVASGELIDDADWAMYRAKENGGAHWVFKDASKSVTFETETFSNSLLTGSKSEVGTTKPPAHTVRIHRPWPSWLLRHLQTLKQTWHSTGACRIPECEERTMHFPPSLFCKAHTR